MSEHGGEIAQKSLLGQLFVFQAVFFRFGLVGEYENIVGIIARLHFTGFDLAGKDLSAPAVQVFYRRNVFFGVIAADKFLDPIACDQQIIQLVSDHLSAAEPEHHRGHRVDVHDPELIIGDDHTFNNIGIDDVIDFVFEFRDIVFPPELKHCVQDLIFFRKDLPDRLSSRFIPGAEPLKAEESGEFALSGIKSPCLTGFPGNSKFSCRMKTCLPEGPS